MSGGSATQKQLKIAGYASCSAFKQAKSALLGLQAIFPVEFSVEVQEYETRDEYMAWLAQFRETIGHTEHETSPIVWFPTGGETNKYLGGRDDTLDWCRQLLSPPTTTTPDSTAEAASSFVDTFDPNHGYDYDLIVIGGGSGGLACSKEAKRQGAQKVAVLDYVKPSPAGSKWGLGGTCVNVGCIPKKLMHHAALLGEHASMAKRFGWDFNPTQANWQDLKTNVQDHIKGLNFGYRVEMRETGVTYLNKLGRFTGPHSMEVTDSKNNKTTITAARFVIAVGGRPTPLNIPGGEHAISSDDIFSLSRSPGHVCVIGGGYVALECAGFLQGLHPQGVEKTTVLVRSVPLRTFDQDTVSYVTAHLRHLGVELLEQTLPVDIVKLENGKFKVRWVTTTNGSSEEYGEGEYDTVLSATGRTPDLTGLTLENIGGTGIQVHPKTGKIVVNHEQTTTPYIYAIGDIVHGGLELTPVAILSGKLLARRLFGVGADLMDYRMIPSAVFTPLELGTVGLSEEDAINEYGNDNVDCYLSQFVPLEWTLDEHPQPCYIKIVVRKIPVSSEEQVIGIHMACPGASEIIQGYAIAMRKGLTMKELTDQTVGIHPTIGEEMTLMKAKKSSSVSIVKSGC